MLKTISLTQKLLNGVVRIEPSSLKFIPDHLKTQGICERGVEDKSGTLEYVPDHPKTKAMC